ncbi:MAG: helix-turn-helix domain-containing protein [Hyphomicrobiales bacterium]
MAKHADYSCNAGCDVELTLQIIGGKWKGVIITLLLVRPYRFNELQKVMPGVTQRILSKQLRDLEEAGIIERVVVSEKPIAVQYSLTELGRTLSPIIRELKAWGLTYRAHAPLSLLEIESAA